MAGPVTDFLSSLDFTSIVGTFNTYGWTNIFFPFLLIYAIVFTILDNVEIFKGGNKKKIRIVIALIFAIISVAFPINDNNDTIGDLISVLFPGVGAITMGILGLYIVAGMMGKDLLGFLDDPEHNKWVKYVLGGVGALFVLFYFGKGMGWFSSSITDNFFVRLILDPGLWILVILFLLFRWVTDDGSTT